MLQVRLVTFAGNVALLCLERFWFVVKHLTKLQCLRLQCSFGIHGSSPSPCLYLRLGCSLSPISASGDGGRRRKWQYFLL